MNELIMPEERKILEEFFKCHLSDDRSLESKVRWLLKYIGLSAANLGYEYIHEAVLKIFEDVELLHCITKKLYPKIAKIYRTTPSKVERAIRHEIELAFSYNVSEEHRKLKLYIFGVNGQKYKITNSEFLAGIVSFIREYEEI